MRRRSRAQSGRPLRDDGSAAGCVTGLWGSPDGVLSPPGTPLTCRRSSACRWAPSPRSPAGDASWSSWVVGGWRGSPTTGGVGIGICWGGVSLSGR